MRLVLNGQLQNQPVLKVAVNSEVERGLLGIATDSATTTIATHTNAKSSADNNNNNNNSSGTMAISNNKNVFLYYTEESSNGQLRNRVYRYQLNGLNLVNPVLILDLPALPGPNHDGGQLALGPSQNHYLVILQCLRYLSLAVSFAAKLFSIVLVDSAVPYPSSNVPFPMLEFDLVFPIFRYWIHNIVRNLFG